MNIKFLRSGEKKRLLHELERQFGIKKLPYLLLETGKQKIRGFSGNMTREEIRELEGIANVEIIGSYLIKRESRLRISLDGTSMLSVQVDKNIIGVSDEEVESWMNGLNLDIVKDKGIYVVRHERTGDFLGCGISDGKKIINHVPKERRVRRS